MKVGRKLGSKNKSVVSANIKEPYIYAVLRIMEQARIDYEDGIKYRANGEEHEGCIDDFWEQWLETNTYKQKEASEFTIACGIASYIGGKR